MLITPPEDVLIAVKNDLKSRRLTQEEIAVKTGYKSRQAIASILSSKKYMTKNQSSRFASAFGYYTLFLTSGTGSLYSEQPIGHERIVTPRMILALRPFENLESFEDAFTNLINNAALIYRAESLVKFFSLLARYLAIYSFDTDLTEEEARAIAERQYIRNRHRYRGMTKEEFIQVYTRDLLSDDGKKEAARRKDFLMSKLYTAYMEMQELSI